MRGNRIIICALGLCALGLPLAGSCNTAVEQVANDVPAADPLPADTLPPEPLPASESRQNAARLVDSSFGKQITIELLQFTGAGTQQRCRPLGGPGVQPWPSTWGGPVTLQAMKNNVIGSSVQGIASEYDHLRVVNETGYCLGMRSPALSAGDPHFSLVEFNLRAVNPWAYGHAPPFDYVNTVDGNQAFYPSNDNLIDRRSLINVNGGDVAILVAGVDFVGNPTNTTAFMNFLGPTGWVLFFRDNAMQSGRFYNLLGALKGGPRAFEDTPPSGDEGFFESAQVNGDLFDANSAPASDVLGPPDLIVGPCPGPADPNPYPKAYAFMDLSNFSEFLGAGPGQGGFLLVIRRQAFNNKGVVINPNVPGPAPMAINPLADTMTPPGSGYNEPAIPAITAPAEDNFLPAQPGVHEIGFSVFFTHGF